MVAIMNRILTLFLLMLSTGPVAKAGMTYPPNKTLGGLWFFSGQECVTDAELKTSGSRLLRSKQSKVSGNEFIVISRDVTLVMQFDRYGSLRMSGDLALDDKNKKLKLAVEFQKQNNPIHFGSDLSLESINTFNLILVTENKAKCPHKIRMAFKRADDDNMHPGAIKHFEESRRR
jgi:hypothetical protein